MATRSTIWYEKDDGSLRGVYCHWDGYLSNNGQILFDNFKTIEKVQDLIENGSLSSLHENINPSTNSHTFDTPESNTCVFYKRDRGEDLSIYEAQTFQDTSKYYEEYNYFFKNNMWYVLSYDGKLKKLTQKLIDKD